MLNDKTEELFSYDLHCCGNCIYYNDKLICDYYGKKVVHPSAYCDNYECDELQNSERRQLLEFR